MSPDAAIATSNCHPGRGIRYPESVIPDAALAAMIRDPVLIAAANSQQGQQVLEHVENVKVQRHGRVALLPSLRIRLKSLIRKEVEKPPQTLGEHVRKRRRQLGLSQAAAGACLGVSAPTVLHWEKGRTEPPIGLMPALLWWLGLQPLSAPQTLQERMLAARRAAGWTIAEAARRLGIDPATWGDWERTGRIAWRRYERLLDSFLREALGE